MEASAHRADDSRDAKRTRTSISAEAALSEITRSRFGPGIRGKTKIGKDIAIEALRTYLRRKDAKAKDLLHFARINRVQAVLAPYVDVLLAAKC